MIILICSVPYWKVESQLKFWILTSMSLEWMLTFTAKNKLANTIQCKWPVVMNFRTSVTKSNGNRNYMRVNYIWIINCYREQRKADILYRKGPLYLLPKMLSKCSLHLQFPPVLSLMVMCFKEQTIFVFSSNFSTQLCIYIFTRLKCVLKMIYSYFVYLHKIGSL